MMKTCILVGFVSLALLVSGCTRVGAGVRTDQQVATDVQNKINADTSFPDKGLTINANNGVVTLSGNVSSDAARAAAANDAAQVEGVKTVVNNLAVAAPVNAANNQPRQSAPDQAASNPDRPATKPSPRQQKSQWRRFESGERAKGSADDTVSTTAASPSDSNAGGNPDSNASASSAPPAPSAPVAPPAPQPVTVPSGTQFSIRLDDEVSSEKAQIGDTFHGSVSAPIVVGDITVIPTSADVEGRVVDVKSAGRFAGQSVLTLQLTKLTMNGRSYSIQTDQWSKSGNGRGKSTAEKVGGGAAVGAILGGIFGGGKGAAIGATAGAGAGTGVSAATKGQQIVLKAEALINFTLQNSVTVTPGSNPQPMTRTSSN